VAHSFPVRFTCSPVIHLGSAVVKLDVHFDRPQRFDVVELPGLYQAGPLGRQYVFFAGLFNDISKPALQHADDRPYPGFGIVRIAKRVRKGNFIKYRRRLVRCGWHGISGKVIIDRLRRMQIGLVDARQGRIDSLQDYSANRLGPNTS
jgi:hypothetical protein